MHCSTTNRFRGSGATQQTRPKSAMPKRSIDLYASSTPLHRKLRQAYNISRGIDTKDASRVSKHNQKPTQTIDSETPEAVYSWLEEFEEAITAKYVGSSFDYPSSKYTQSKRLTDSKGYKKVKMMKKC